MAEAKIRLFVDHPLCPAQTVPLSRDQAHYLFGVMRQREGAKVLLFNGKDGEFLATIAEADKRKGLLICEERTRALELPPDIWILFAPLKKARTDFLVEKVVELGAARLVPVQTEFTNAERIRDEKIRAHAVEAAEQCGATYVPEAESLQKLGAVLDNWPADRALIFCDEALAGREHSLKINPGPAAILIGPEGGFSPEERKKISSMPQALPISLGPRILRAETAALAALTMWQSQVGDWYGDQDA
ncbi:MAG: 16S rRNA (uracil(1498)-N(3))-methyltransferase [Paracoccaceae bacterium]|nr:16S rRNA (uracil(1498)-N(3))-methyltransferase [Paracoccaceae bacterium]